MVRKRSSDPQVVSERLKQLRKETGIKTQTILHRMTGIPLISIKRYESGETIPEDPNLRILADFYHVDSAWILGKTPYRNKWDQYNRDHSEEVKKLSIEVTFLEMAEHLGFINPEDPESYEEFHNYVRLFQERRNAMKTRKDITVVTGSKENRIIVNFDTGEIIIHAVTEEDAERAFQQLIRRGIIAE